MKTYIPKTDHIKRTWHEIDASKFTLGRLATHAATLLRGKHKVDFTPHQDRGDYVVVTNADKIRITGKKLEQKVYYRYTGYPGGVRSNTLSRKLAQDPVWVIRHAVRGMLDDNRLRKHILRRLKIVKGQGHKHPVKK
jgi:large subunit ribosomal protein L13